jgi:predicted DNA-binding protein (UPF0251 family)
MPRPIKCRRVNFIPGVNYFKPAGIPLRLLDEVRLCVEEAEALRLKDLEDLDQEQCAQRMNISRATFQRVLEAARKKTSDALLNGKAIRIEGGNFEIAPFRFQCQNGHVWEAPYGFMAKELGQSCPVCNSTVVAPLQPLEPEQVAHGWGRCRRGRAGR